MCLRAELAQVRHVMPTHCSRHTTSIALKIKTAFDKFRKVHVRNIFMYICNVQHSKA